MKRPITIDISPATETHCGDVGRFCPQLSPLCQCRLFGWNILKRDEGRAEYKRLPECLAAEQKGNQ